MIIYTAENKERKCIYVGYATKGLEHRKKSHHKDCFNKNENYRFYNTIRKYGLDSFEWKVRSPYPTEDFELLKKREIFWIKYYRNHYDGEVLNLTDGGGGVLGYKHSEESNKKKSIAMSGDKNPFFGKHHSEESLKKQSISHLGKYPSEETLKKKSEAMKGEKNHMFGKHLSEETLEKMSIAKSGENHPNFGKRGEETSMFGKHHSKEQRKIWSEKRSGENNPMSLTNRAKRKALNGNK